jgi:hypothetical protein
MRSRCRWSVTNAHCAKPPDVCLAIGAIAIANNIVRWKPPNRKPRQLSSDPFSRRVCHHPSHMIRRRWCRRTRKPQSSRKESVGTTNRSIETMLQRRVLRPCDRPPLLRAMYFATLVRPTSKSSLSSSQWMRGAPQSGLAKLMSRISRRISSGTLGLSLHQCQNDRNPARCPRTTVSGRTVASVSKIPGARRYNPTNTNRSKVPKTNLFRDLRRSTLICCRRIRISASSRILELNKLASAVHTSMRTSTIGHEHHPIRRARQPDRVSDKDSWSDVGRTITTP